MSVFVEIKSLNLSHTIQYPVNDKIIIGCYTDRELKLNIIDPKYIFKK